MKKVALILSLALSVIVANVSYAQEPKVEGVTFSTTYLPGGFDSNDNVQIIAEGAFRNSCYRPAVASAVVNKNTKTISISGKSYVYEGFCIQMIVPFHQVINVGVLPPGKYEVVQPASENRYELGELKIKPRSSTAADDYLYAPVSQAYFAYDREGNPFIRITGYFTNSCMSMKDLLVDVKDNVIVVQPIAQMKESGTCNKGRFKFSKAIDISDVELGRYLLHVRSLNGQAINTLIDIDE